MSLVLNKLSEEDKNSLEGKTFNNNKIFTTTIIYNYFFERFEDIKTMIWQNTYKRNKLNPYNKIF